MAAKIRDPELYVKWIYLTNIILSEKKQFEEYIAFSVNILSLPKNKTPKLRIMVTFGRKD